jgi:plastocyanin
MLAAPVLAIVVAACSTASGAPVYTYAPSASGSAYDPGATAGSSDPGSSPSMSPALGGYPSASATAMPTASVPPALASGAPFPTGGGAPVGAAVRISARNIQFDTDHLAGPAGQAWVLEFANNDAGIPHNVEILDATGASVFKGQIVTGPTTVAYQVPALPAGGYTFLCDVHPTMTGTLTVA